MIHDGTSVIPSEINASASAKELFQIRAWMGIYLYLFNRQHRPALPYSNMFSSTAIDSAIVII